MSNKRNIYGRTVEEEIAFWKDKKVEELSFFEKLSDHCEKDVPEIGTISKGRTP